MRYSLYKRSVAVQWLIQVAKPLITYAEGNYRPVDLQRLNLTSIPIANPREKAMNLKLPQYLI